jgi:MerR family transcriptional regulator, copper efflux regulator
MNIGEAATASGVSAKMLRYYERIGLIPAARRTESGYRAYGEAEVHTLRFVHRARSLGFSIEETRGLLALWRDRSRASADVKALALRHVRDLEVRLAEMEAMRRTLQHLAASCHGDGRPDCPILDDLAGEGERPARGGAAGRRAAESGRH